jgi:hypothetical protein
VLVARASVGRWVRSDMGSPTPVNTIPFKGVGGHHTRPPAGPTQVGGYSVSPAETS